jgi:hypothetical protein
MKIYPLTFLMAIERASLNVAKIFFKDSNGHVYVMLHCIKLKTSVDIRVAK